MKYPREIKTEQWGRLIHFYNPNKKAFFDINTIAKLRDDVVDINATSTPHRHDFYQLIWCVEGSGYHYLDFNKDEIRNGRIFFCAPEQCHSMDGNFSLPQGYGIMFNDEFLNELNAEFVYEIKYNFFRRYNRKSYLDIPIIGSERLLEIVQFMQEECENHKEGYKHNSCCLHLLAWFFIELKRLASDSKNSMNGQTMYNSGLLYRFVEFVENHYKERLPISYYANELGCSESKLNRVCKTILKESPLKVINKRITDEAKRMLSFSQQTIKEISFSLGFPSQTYFVAFFQKNTGLSPNEFRKANGG